MIEGEAQALMFVVCGVKCEGLTFVIDLKRCGAMSGAKD